MLLFFKRRYFEPEVSASNSFRPTKFPKPCPESNRYSSRFAGVPLSHQRYKAKPLVLWSFCSALIPSASMRRILGWCLSFHLPKSGERLSCSSWGYPLDGMTSNDIQEVWCSPRRQWLLRPQAFGLTWHFTSQSSRHSLATIGISERLLCPQPVLTECPPLRRHHRQGTL